MKTIDTQIIIEAPGHIVWSHLTDFAEYPNWNHFIISIEGQLKLGAEWHVTLKPPGGNQMHFKPLCTKLIIGKQLQWKGKILAKGLFDGEHIFVIEPIDEERTLFIQKENFSGILVPIMWNSIREKTQAGFNLMNQQLKERSESASWRKIN